LTVEDGAAVPGPSGQQLCRYPQLNGVPAKPLTVGLDGRVTGEAILAHAKTLGCDLLIKGAYTQSRLRQMIFGGTTRYILSNAELPVLMAHWGEGATKDGGTLHTIRDAWEYMTAVSKEREQRRHWQQVRKMILDEEANMAAVMAAPARGFEGR
jgi:universal stress protein family protein